MDIAGDAKEGSSSSGDCVSKLRVQCPSLEEKNSWVAAINSEIKQLKCLAKSLSFD